ncbi:hypothetical protein Nepgr_029470 [Nepenthes gracilis]|uniref:Bet v I/Major latex protein domain-containing protein n=1 Tax=Nepenthes gracilis TaxID=150966 RepID=A0AAD3Y315_NEPGR|nr:hypothetical protein Nepgr_029470 [Nepenthes gracilis]
MASPGKLELVVEVKSSPDKFWESLRNTETVFLKVFPETYKSIEVVEGDGKSVGSARLFKFAEGIPLITTSKERIDEVDEAKKTMGYSVIEGELLNYFKSFKAKVAVAPKAPEGSVVTWTCEYEKTSEEVSEPEHLKDFAGQTFEELDAFLIKAN